MGALSRPRWLRYGIRTMLLVVTASCLWLGWQWRVVHQRKVVRQLIARWDGEIDNTLFVSVAKNTLVSRSIPPRVSWLRQAMGDEGIRRIIVYANLSADEKAKIATTFPEAELVTDRIGEAVKAVTDDESLN